MSRRRVRIGGIEELILRNIYEREPKDRGEELYRVGEKYRRATYSGWGMATLLGIRDYIYGAENIDASKRAGFSRAVRTLESRGLIETRNYISGKKGYRTHAKLTEKGKALVEEVIEPRILKIKNQTKPQTLTIGGVPKC